MLSKILLKLKLRCKLGDSEEYAPTVKYFVPLLKSCTKVVNLSGKELEVPEDENSNLFELKLMEILIAGIYVLAPLRTSSSLIFL